MLRVRLRHPLLFGVVATFLYNVTMGVVDFLKTREMIFLKAGMFMALYHALLYYHIWKYRREGSVR
jgi:hypothetical protein